MSSNSYRLYDREGNGYITTGTLKEILAALDDNLTSRDLDGIIAEIDTDGSGTVDFDGMYKIANRKLPLNNFCLLFSNITKNIFFRIHGNDDG